MRCLISQDLLLNWLVLHLEMWPVTCDSKTLYLFLAFSGPLGKKKSFRVVWQNYWFNSINGGQPHLQTGVITTSEESEMRLSHFLSWHLCVMSVRLRNVLKLFFLWQLVPWSSFWWLWETPQLTKSSVFIFSSYKLIPQIKTNMCHCSVVP